MARLDEKMARPEGLEPATFGPAGRWSSEGLDFSLDPAFGGRALPFLVRNAAAHGDAVGDVEEAAFALRRWRICRRCRDLSGRPYRSTNRNDSGLGTGWRASHAFERLSGGENPCGRICSCFSQQVVRSMLRGFVARTAPAPPLPRPHPRQGGPPPGPPRAHAGTYAVESDTRPQVG